MKRVLYVLLVIVSLFILALMIKPDVLSNSISKFSFFDANNIETEKFENAFDTMYISLIDNAAEVIDSTKPDVNKSINYDFSDNKEPNKKILLDDKLFVLLDIYDNNAPNGLTGLKENVIYYYKLPSYIKPLTVYSDSNSIDDDCYHFMQEGKLMARGGVYKEADGYYFKIKFVNVKNKREVRLSYQFDINLDESIEDFDSNIKDINFGKYGNLQVWYKNAIPEIQNGNDYTLTASNDGWTSKTKNYINWTVILNNKNIDNITNKGVLDVEFSNYHGNVFDYGYSSSYLDVFIDGEKLCYRGTDINSPEQYVNGNIFFGRCSISNEKLITVSPIEIDDPNYSYGNYLTASVIKKYKIYIHGDEGGELTDFSEFKFIFKNREYSKDGNNTLLTKVKYIDELKNEKYENEGSIYKDSEPINISYSVTTDESNSAGLPTSLNHVINIENNNNNYLEMEEQLVTNNSGLHYYMNGKGISEVVGNIEDSFKVYINNELVHFYKYGNGIDSFVSGQLTPKDPGTQLQLENFTFYQNLVNMNINNSYLIARGDKVNDDGDYYWLVFDPNTAKFMQNSSYGNIDGNFMYKDNSSPIAKEPNFKIYLFNIANENVRIEFKKYLKNFEENFILGNVVNKKRESKVEVNGLYSSSEYTFEKILNPLRMRGVNVGNGFIRWDVEFFKDYVNDDQLFLNDLIMYLPTNQSLRRTYYDYVNNNIVDEPNVNTIDTSKIYACTSETIIPNSSYKKCNSYVPFPAANQEIGFERDDTYNNYNIIYPSSGFSNLVGYNSYSANLNFSSLETFSPIKFSFFTHIDGVGTQNSIYTDPIKFQIAGQNFKSAPYHSYEIGVEGIAALGKINKELLYSHMSNDKIVKKWFLEIPYYDYVNNSNMFSDVYENAGITNIKAPIYYNGKYVLRDKMKVTNEVEEAIAKNTIVKNVNIYYSGVVIGSLSNNTITMEDRYQDNDGTYKLCDSENRCVRLNFDYGPNCPVFSKSNPKCNHDEENLYNGFTVSTDYEDYFVASVVFEYETYTNVTKVLAELASYFKDVNANVSNNASIGDWGQDGNSFITTSKKENYNIMANLSIDKKVLNSKKTHYDNDTYSQETIITNGTGNSNYIEDLEFIDAVANYSFVDGEYKIGNQITDINVLKEIRKYVDIENIKVTLKNNHDDSSEIVYSNGNFISNYANSTLEMLEGSNKLFKLHLVANNGIIYDYHQVIVDYDLVFDVDKNANFRNNSFYTGEKINISTNAEGIRTFGNFNQINVPDDIPTQNYTNRIDTANNRLIAYASNNGGEIGAAYLERPYIFKSISSDNNGINSWSVKYNVNSIGKSAKANINIIDYIDIDLNNDTDYNDEIVSVIKKHTKYNNLKVYYNGTNTNTDITPIFVSNGLNENINNGIVGEISYSAQSYSLNLSSFNYGDIVIITYDTETDINAIFRELLEKNIINNKNIITGTNYTFGFKYKNSIKDTGFEKVNSGLSSSNISVSDYIPLVTKSFNKISNDEIKWNIKLNTGLTSDKIKVVDLIDIIANNNDNKEAIKNAIDIKNLEIKIGDTIVYSNDGFAGNWGENIKIDKKMLGLNIELLDSTNNEFLNSNKQVLITYNTIFDKDKYNSRFDSDKYSINNNVEISKSGLTDNDSKSIDDLIIDYPIITKKEYLGNPSEKLSETNWKIEIDSNNVKRKNVVIKDTAILGYDFGKYLSISDFKVIKNDEIIFDYRNNINNLEGIEILDLDGNILKFETNNIYQFKVNISEMLKNDKIIIDYILKVDSNEYIINDEIINNEMLIKNSSRVTVDAGEEIVKEVNGRSRVLSKISKRAVSKINYSDGNKGIKWEININLLDYYDLDEIANKEIVITDELPDMLEYVDNSLAVYKNNYNDYGFLSFSLVDEEYYEASIVDNKIIIKILKPRDLPRLSIKFDTRASASLDSIINYVSLDVDGEREEIKGDNPINDFTPNLFGFITSKGILIYNIKGEKLLDGKPSNKDFVFSLVEVNKNGEEKIDGYKYENSNGPDGEIVFNGITFLEEGLYYYRIKEIVGNDNYEYDSSEYILRLKVIETHGEFVVSNYDILNSSNNKLVFNNLTKEEKSELDVEDEDLNNEIIVNPPTRDIYNYLIIAMVLSLTILLYFKVSKLKNQIKI